MPTPDPPGLQDVLDRIPDLLPRLNADILRIHLTELLKWNPQLGLVSKRSTVDRVAHLVRQSIDFWEFVATNAPYKRRGAPWRVADIGSGGGFPGLIWNALAPTMTMVLIERKERRVYFLDAVLHRLPAGNVRVVAGDVEDIALDPQYRDHFDLAAMMAVGPPGAMGPIIEPMLRPGGFLAAMRPSSEAAIGVEVGERLHLQAQAHNPEATYLLYQKR